jgi:hypothetical protein
MCECVCESGASLVRLRCEKAHETNCISPLYAATAGKLGSLVFIIRGARLFAHQLGRHHSESGCDNYALHGKWANLKANTSHFIKSW